MGRFQIIRSSGGFGFMSFGFGSVRFLQCPVSVLKIRFRSQLPKMLLFNSDGSRNGHDKARTCLKPIFPSPTWPVPDFIKQTGIPVQCPATMVRNGYELPINSIDWPKWPCDTSLERIFKSKNNGMKIF